MSLSLLSVSLSVTDTRYTSMKGTSLYSTVKICSFSLDMSDTNLEGGCCRNTLLSNLVRFHRALAWRPNGAIAVWLTCEFRLEAVASMTQRHRRKTRLSFQARGSSNIFKYRMYKSYQIVFHLMQTIRDCAQLQKFLAGICFKPVLQCCTQRKRFLEPHSRLQSRQHVSKKMDVIQSSQT